MSTNTDTLFNSVWRAVSSVIHNRRSFVVVVVLISIVKLLLSMLAPASFDLRDIVKLFNAPNAPIGPWVALYPPLYAPWIPKGTIDSWINAPPMSTDPSFLLLSFLFRFPTFAFDFATMTILYYAGTRLGSPDNARLASLIWYANPYSFLGIELLGVPDVVATFLVVLSFALIISRRLLPAAAVLAVGIFFKLFPLIILPPVFLYLSSQGFSGRRLAGALSLVLLGLIGYVAWLLPSGLYFVSTYSPVTQPLPFFAVAPYVVNGAAFGIISFYCLQVLFAKRDILIPSLVSAIMVYYLLSNPSPQYFVWVLPLVALDIVFVNRSRTVVAIAFYLLAFAEWFLASSVFLTPSNYSLLMLPIGVNNPPAYLIGIRNFLDSALFGTIVLPIVYSALYSSIFVYAIDAVRSWFALPKSPQM